MEGNKKLGERHTEICQFSVLISAVMIEVSGFYQCLAKQENR